MAADVVGDPGGGGGGDHGRGAGRGWGWEAHIVRQASQRPPLSSARWPDGNTHAGRCSPSRWQRPAPSPSGRAATRRRHRGERTLTTSRLETTAAGPPATGLRTDRDAAAGLCRTRPRTAHRHHRRGRRRHGPGRQPVFLRSDGSEFNYVVDGCTFEVAVPDDDEPDTRSTGTPPEGTTLRGVRVGRRPEDMELSTGSATRLRRPRSATRRSADRRPGRRQRATRRSQLPFGVPVADTLTLVALAELAGRADRARRPWSAAGLSTGGRPRPGPTARPRRRTWPVAQSVAHCDAEGDRQ